MKVYVLKKDQEIPRPLNEVFAFFQDPANLAVITPKSLGFRILTPPPHEMKAGAIIDYIISLGIIPVHWRTMITDYQPPYSFVDEQLKGPYTFWHHRHIFHSRGDTTSIVDEIYYALPFGILGRLAHFLFVRRQLEGIFYYRADAISRIFSTSCNLSESKGQDNRKRNL